MIDYTLFKHKATNILEVSHSVTDEVDIFNPYEFLVLIVDPIFRPENLKSVNTFTERIL